MTIITHANEQPPPIGIGEGRNRLGQLTGIVNTIFEVLLLMLAFADEIQKKTFIVHTRCKGNGKNHTFAIMTQAPYQSPFGTLIMVSDGNSLTELKFWEPKEMSNYQDLPIFKETRLWLDLYFSGNNPQKTPPLNPQGTPFQQKVWQELLKIPYGQTTSYGAIAKRIGCHSAQAIGQAVHNNPIAIIIPCHRVIGADGSLTGYASGLDIKLQLLKLEFGGCLWPAGPDTK